MLIAYEKEILTVNEVAKVLQVNQQTVRKWIRNGKLKASKPTGKNYIIQAQDLKKFINGNNEDETETNND